MPRLIKDFHKEIVRRVDDSLSLTRAGERIRAWLVCDETMRNELSAPRLELLYEMAFLRLFIAWETFLEETFLRYLCGFRSSGGAPTLLKPPFRSLDDARSDLFGGREYVSWYDPDKIIKRSRAYITSGTHELVVASNKARLEWFAAVRHRIAHASAFARQEFDSATAGLAGRRYTGARAGRFLRDIAPHTLPPERWLESIGNELGNLAGQITP